MSSLRPGACDGYGYACAIHDGAERETRSDGDGGLKGDAMGRGRGRRGRRSRGRRGVEEVGGRWEIGEEGIGWEIGFSLRS